MRYVSLFSGIEAASVAWEPLGWEPVCFSEIDPFPSAVLAYRYPDVPNLGDITKIDWKMVRRKYGQIDLVVGGSPCQSFSVAGTRTGLQGASGLMWEYVRCVRELMPRWLLWENVPGALSSTHGEDFGCLLRELDALGYGLAWRVLDAQFFGLAQRRERLFVVGRLGDVEGPCEVLFEPESLPWNPQSSREKRQALAGDARRCAASAGGGAGGGADALDVCVQGNIARGARMGQNGAGVTSDGSSYTLDTLDIPAVVAPSGTQLYEIQGNAIGRAEKNGPRGRDWCDPDDNGAYSLTACDRHAVTAPTVFIGGDHKASESVDCAGTLPASSGGFTPGAVMCMTDTQPHSMVDGEVCGTLTATMHKDPPVVGFAANQRGELRLQGGDGTVVGAVPASQSGKQVQGVAQGYAVRRLTPRECERLMGMPDDWTKVPYRDKPAEECPDTPRYKAIGNSMAVPVMRWIGMRIQEEES